jgi:hypothetical protein
MFEFRHAYFSSAELYPFHLQPKALVQGMLAWRCDPSSGGDDAMPGQSMRLVQSSHNNARRSRITSGQAYSAITGNLTARDLHDGLADAQKHLVSPFGFCHGV